VFAVGLAGCSSTPPTTSGLRSEACSILNDSYGQFLPKVDKVKDPRGYWDESVVAQSGYVSRIEKLTGQDLLEEKLLSDYLGVTKDFLSVAKKQQMLVRVGETAYEFQHRLTKAEFDSWQADGKHYQVLYQKLNQAWQAYANYCSFQ
jgi:hypothetical protein